MGRELATLRNPQRLLERIVDMAIRLSGAERGLVALQGDEPDSPPVIHAARNIDRQSLSLLEQNLSRTVFAKAMASKTPLTTVNAAEDSRFSDEHSVRQLNLRSILCLPLCPEGQVLGVLYLDNRYRTEAFTEADISTLSAFTDQAAIALANARLVDELERKQRALEHSQGQIDELNQRLQRELESTTAEMHRQRDAIEDAWAPSERHGMVGVHPSLEGVRRLIDRVAPQDVSVLIVGESGTGKELVARAVHRASKRREQNFVGINCGALAPELLESELFGHSRGAFTGAVRHKPGLLEIADQGTLFLDEVAQMPPQMQVKLLRVLQTGDYRRIGETQVRQAHARILAATNANLTAMIEARSFREDLYYRLNVVEIAVPPLRERRSDIPALVIHLLGTDSVEDTLEKETLKRLLDYDWPGNIRELENELQRAKLLGKLPLQVADLSARIAQPGRVSGTTLTNTLKDTTDRFEASVIMQCLVENDWVVSRAAKSLGITRAGLYKKIHKYSIELRNDSTTADNNR